MRRDVLEIDGTWHRASTPLPFHLQDAEAVRLILTGDSVVDWQRLAFRTLEDVDAFLATHLLSFDDPEDRQRIRYVFNEAVSYLEEQLHLRFPRELRDPADVRRVFLWASEPGGFRRTQILSCVILKLMHIINHMEAADLKFRLSQSEEEVIEWAHRRLVETVRGMQDRGVPIVGFYGSRKSRSSIITKLLAKKEAVAAQVFDKLRYRVLVEHLSDVAPVLALLAREVFPFNYVVPGQCHNNLLAPEEVPLHLSEDERAEALARTSIPVPVPPKNEFSGASYRSINWIADYPVRITDMVTRDLFAFELGRVVYVNVEFQLLDQETARLNEEGENAHALYKARKYERVAARLKRGANPRRKRVEDPGS
jgi:uncharacterized protein (TIGR04552 family)